jgi:hypothetical protein
MRYSLEAFGSMIRDTIRMDAYARALASSVDVDSIVLDIGAGTGIFSLLAGNAGARRVYMVESNGGALQIARELVAANGFGDRTTVLHSLSTDISLPEPATLVISDLRGSLPYYANNISSVIDARTRHLHPGGRLIALRDSLHAALISDHALYAELAAPWREDCYGIDASAVWSYASHQRVSRNIAADSVVTDAIQLAELDYTAVDDLNLDGEGRWVMESECLIHGFALWFDSQLTPDIGFSNRPGNMQTVYGQVFFPFLRPLRVRRGQSIVLRITAKFIENDYVWSWITQHSADKGNLLSRFKQSSALAMPFPLHPDGAPPPAVGQ